MIEAPWVRQFSCPLEESDARVFDVIALAEARGLVQWLAGDCRAEIDAVTEGVTSLFDEWLQAPTSFDSVWDLSFGRVRQAALSFGRIDPINVAVPLAVRLTEMGQKGAWRSSAPRNTPLQVGAFLLAPASTIEVDSDSHRTIIVVEGTDGIRRKCSRDVGSSTGWFVEGVEPLCAVGVNRPVYLLRDMASDNDILEFDGERALPTIDDSVVSAFTEGMNLLEVHSQDYLPWVERVLRAIAVCPGQLSHAVSGSGENRPGIIHVSHPLGPMDIAEILVHEATHQYFYLVERTGDVANADHTRLYWSSAAGRHRPLSRILMAYHAFANVLLFYKACHERGTPVGDYLARMEGETRIRVAQLGETLRTASALTPLGRGLYEPLAEHLEGYA